MAAFRQRMYVSPDFMREYAASLHDFLLNEATPGEALIGTAQLDRIVVPTVPNGPSDAVEMWIYGRARRVTVPSR